MMNTKKMLCRIITLMMVSALLFGCNESADTTLPETKELNIYTWADYIPGEVIADFEAETGIKVNYSYFSDNETMLSIMKTHKEVYDIIVCSDYAIDHMVQEGDYLEELDWSLIPNNINIEPAFKDMHYDPENKYTIPHTFGSSMIIYDESKTGFELESFDDLWDSRLEGGLVLLDGARDSVGMTLQSMDHSLNETDPDILEEAAQKLYALKKNVIALNADTPHDSIISGDAMAGVMFASQAEAALAVMPDLKVVYPEEGSCFWIDNYVMAKNPPNKANAHTFLNYILNGEVSAKISMIINYSNANVEAKQYLSEEFINNEIINIPTEFVNKCESYLNLGDAAILYDEIWTNFLSQ